MVIFLKKLFYKIIFSWDWFGIYTYLVKNMVKIKVEQKVNWDYKITKKDIY
jgi:hypothetical protein